jgi:hypothetical protein
MLITLAFLSLVLVISVGNLALGFGLAVYLKHGPAQGWQALCFWQRKTPVAGHH